MSLQYSYPNPKNISEPGNQEYIENELRKFYPTESIHHVDIWWSRLLSVASLEDIYPYASQNIICFHMYEEASHGAIEFIFKNFLIPRAVNIKKTIFIVASDDEANYINLYCKSRNLSIPGIFTYTLFERLVKRKIYINNISEPNTTASLEELISNHDYRSFDIKSPLENNNIEKMFLYLSGQIQDVASLQSIDIYRLGMRRQHRIILFLALAAKGLLDKGYISFPKFSFRESLSWISNLRLELQTLVRQGYNMEVKLPLILDNVKLDDTLKFTADCASINDKIISFYKNSMFSIVPETHFFTTDIDKRKCRFLTEKTFNPISLKHPFMIASVPGTLDAIRKLGYKTFDGIIDESYDTIKGDGLRLLKIIEEIERLCNLDKDTLTDYRARLLPIVEYNYNHFMERKNYLIKVPGDSL